MLPTYHHFKQQQHAHYDISDKYIRQYQSNPHNVLLLCGEILFLWCMDRKNRRKKSNKISLSHFYFYSIFAENRTGGFVKLKIKKLWLQVNFANCVVLTVFIMSKNMLSGIIFYQYINSLQLYINTARVFGFCHWRKLSSQQMERRTRWFYSGDRSCLE